MKKIFLGGLPAQAGSWVVSGLAALLLVSGFFILPVLVFAQIELQVTPPSPTAVKTAAISNGTFTNGWSFVFDTTVPLSETMLTMKFADLTNGSSTITAANNVRFFSPQSVNAYDGDHAINITASSTHSAVMNINSAMDIDANSENGRQIQITVEIAIPANSVTASSPYVTSYEIKTDAPAVVPPENPNPNPTPVLGCTNPSATNYNNLATQDDGSCTLTPQEPGNPPQLTYPVITLLGESPQHIVIGQPYVELGATADDGSPITIDTSLLMVNQIGSYSIRYFATNSFGTSSNERIVMVTQVPPPPSVIVPVIIGPQGIDGPFSAPVTITLQTPTEGATIYYTRDGSNPHPEIDLALVPGTLQYANGTSIVISQTTTIQAMAVKAGMTSSGTMAQTYQINLPE